MATIKEMLTGLVSSRTAAQAGTTAFSRETAEANWPLRTAAVLLCLVLVSTYLLSGLYARHATTANGSDSARVALFGHDETVTLDEESLQGLKPGDSRTYTIAVTNARGENVSEVAQRYSINVVTAGNLPLEFSLKKGSELVSSDSTGKTFSADDMVFAEGESKQEVKYTLTATWPASKNGSKYAGVPDFIQVNVNAQQID